MQLNGRLKDVVQNSRCDYFLIIELPGTSPTTVRVQIDPDMLDADWLYGYVASFEP